MMKSGEMTALKNILIEMTGADAALATKLVIALARIKKEDLDNQEVSAISSKVGPVLREFMDRTGNRINFTILKLDPKRNGFRIQIPAISLDMKFYVRKG